MRKVHIITIIIAAGLIALLYFGINTIPPAKPTTANGNAPMASNGTMPDMPMPASTDSIILASNKALPKHAQTELAETDKRISQLSDSAQMIPLFEQQAAIWQEHKNLPMAAISKSRAAHLAHSEKMLTFAARFNVDIAQHSEQPSMVIWAAQQAIEDYNAVLAINPNNDTAKLELASCYIEGTNEVMKGVGILREMTAKNPDHIAANTMLGAMSLQSGQFEKAVTRFETVLKHEPANKSALLGLAAAYEGMGNKTKADEVYKKFEQLKK